MEIPSKLKEYIDGSRGSLPPLTDPDEPPQIDSLGLVRLVAFLETIGYRIEDEELIAENFATLRSLGELLATKAPTAPIAIATSEMGTTLQLAVKSRSSSEESSSANRASQGFRW